MSQIEMKYHGTYYYANIIQEILNNHFDYLHTIEPLFCNSGILYYTAPFTKWSNLHHFLYFVIEDFLYKQAYNWKLRKCLSKNIYITPIEYALRDYNLEHISFMEWAARENYNQVTDEYIYYYFQEIMCTESYEPLINRMVEDVFYILFLNRELLKEFNLLLSGYLELELQFNKIEANTILEDSKQLSTYIRQDFKLYRKSIPKWVKKAVFFRDRGRCVFCNKDLSGILSIFNNENYDHIVPLNQHGFNDVTNIQLLCESCNKRKSDKDVSTSDKYQKWYAD